MEDAIAYERGDRSRARVAYPPSVDVKDLRKRLKMSQQTLAKHIDVSFQQIQKLEKAQNRISASCLYEPAMALDVSVLDFFDGLNNPIPPFTLYGFKHDDWRLAHAINSLHDGAIKETRRVLATQIINRLLRMNA